MALKKWRLEGEWLKNCTCAYGCPCDFSAKPAEGWCKGVVAMHIDKGHFDGVNLDGLNFAVTVHFPGALHEGNGTIQPIVDERASAAQRSALLEILSGKHSAEGTLFNIFSLIASKVHDPAFGPFDWRFDEDGRGARMRIAGLLETQVDATAANIRSSGALKFEVSASHTSLARVVQTAEGIAA